jgi:hypothetical protein
VFVNTTFLLFKVAGSSKFGILTIPLNLAELSETKLLKTRVLFILVCPKKFTFSSTRKFFLMVTESLTIKEESIFAVPLTCNRDDGVVVPIPTFPVGGRVLVWAETVNNVKKQPILNTVFVVFTKNSLGIDWK